MYNVININYCLLFYNTIMVLGYEKQKNVFLSVIKHPIYLKIKICPLNYNHTHLKHIIKAKLYVSGE